MQFVPQVLTPTIHKINKRKQQLVIHHCCLQTTPDSHPTEQDLKQPQTADCRDKESTF